LSSSSRTLDSFPTRRSSDLPPTSDISDANFTVKGTIAAQSPTPGMVAGEVRTVGSSATIAWATTGTIATIKIEYSTNGFSDETQDRKSTRLNSSHEWISYAV